MQIPPETFLIDRASAQPLQLQLRRQIIRAVHEGRLRPGERMPSSRALAAHLGLGRITVTQAYGDLVATDYLIAQGRSGYFVSDRVEELRPEPAPDTGAPRFDWSTLIEGRNLAAKRKDRPTDWRRYPYPFLYGQTDDRLIDHAAWRDCAVRALGRRDLGALSDDQYDNDDPELVDFIIRHLLPRRGIQARPDEILLTLGAQNALWMICAILLRRGVSTVIEEPGYPGLHEILRTMDARVLPVPIDADGLPPERIPHGVSAVFCSPSHQCPTNRTMPLARREALLRLADQRGFAVIEDDYEFEISFAGSTSPALKAMDRSGAVIHIGSFSKSVFPGLRLGYIVADPDFVAEARALRGMMLRHPPGHVQRTMAYFLSLGHYDRQVKRMRNSYAERRRVTSEALSRHGLDSGQPAGAGGSSFWLQTPAGLDSDVLARALKPEGVLIEPGRPFFHDGSDGTGHYRLAYSSIAARDIEEGVRRIAQTCERLAGQDGTSRMNRQPQV
ncbi:aminotransferase class I/II-fold pyridoxal phosphate-dependent enzyme [Paracoccus aestuariivivens]|uniref:Aminotransferase class I/II-fold pyridoxal phosphate-dependent enzyme n=2 Tax=Paracoccus aestuariivivens TaxID=1820333 RepID=A0A6L6JK01_9RHOB|nr:PLP-dependent aminotransferase family protein [Paracoccus aestuariivivens]MTH80191.1 aminotransferase class I/II-fold pyridoxal phosphate-dependent enzyme [Paracoccus aestuariivivens]